MCVIFFRLKYFLHQLNMPFCKFLILLVIQVLQKLYTKVVKYSNNIDTLQTASFKIIAVNLQNFRFLFANDMCI